MSLQHKSRISLLLIYLTTMLVVVSGIQAQDDDEAVPLIELPLIDPVLVSGDIATAGSSTVGPLTERMIQRFTEDGYADDITNDQIGTGAGFEQFCVDLTTDISNASRPIKDEEYDACIENERTPLAFRVGTDALAVVVSSNNDFVQDVTIDELAMIFSEANTWSEVNATWPDEPIERFIPGTDSGTFDYFAEAIFADDQSMMLSASDLFMSEDDQVLATEIGQNPYAIGFFGYAYYLRNEDNLQALRINGIAPSAESTEATGDDAYPLARPLFIYTASELLAEKPHVAAFLTYYLTFVNEEIEAVGYFAASPAATNTARQDFLDALDALETSD